MTLDETECAAGAAPRPLGKRQRNASGGSDLSSHPGAHGGHEETDLLLARVCWGAALALASFAVVAALNVVVLRGYQLPVALGAIVSTGTLLGARSAAARRQPVPLAVVFVTSLGGILIYCASLSFAELEALVGLVVCMMVGSALLLPWGPRVQAGVSGLVLAGYGTVLGLTAGAPSDHLVRILLGLAISGVLSVVGAALLQRFRQRTLWLSAQQEQLLQIGQDLNGTLDMAGLAARIVRHGRLLVPCDWVALCLLEERRRVFRVVAAETRPGRTAPEGLFDIEFPADPWPEKLPAQEAGQDPRAGTLAVLAAPAGDPLLNLTIERDGRPMGMLSFGGPATGRFTPSQIRLARGLAHQAATAIENARLVANLRQADLLKSEFISTVSHEIRTPLAVIMGSAEMLADPHLPEAERHRSVETIERASRQLLDLVEATLDVGRIEAGEELMSWEPVNMRDLWSELAQDLADTPRGAAVALEWQPAPPVSVLTDRQKLKIVLKNLVGNALKFTSAGSVSVACEADGDRCRLSVRDTGTGIRAEDREIIFEMFRQADGSDRRPHQGVGLGLYIVRRLVEQLGGTISLESEVGKGSTFTVSLPWEPDSRTEPAPRRRLPPS